MAAATARSSILAGYAACPSLDPQALQRLLEQANLDIVARTKAVAVDKAQLSTGGAIQVAVVDTKMDADFSNQVSVGNNAKLASLGYLNLGTTTTGSLNSQALVNTWGLAAVGSGDVKPVVE